MRTGSLQLVAARDDVHWVSLGVIVGTHGLRGDLRFKQYNQDSELLFELTEIALRVQGRLQVHALSGVRAGGKGLLLHLAGVDAIEAAEALRGAELCVPRATLPALPEGEYYHVDLEGLTVTNRAGESVGIVESVRAYPAAEVLRVRSEDGVWEVPMREPYLVEVALAESRIVVDHLADLELEKS
jgi:16S rRNA processing protein RimM